VIFPHEPRNWTSTIATLSPNHDGTPYRRVDAYKRPDALTPENSSEEDREVDETPIFLRSERYSQMRAHLQNGRFTPNSGEEIDEDGNYAGYNRNRYSAYSDYNIPSNRSSPTPRQDDYETEEQPTSYGGYLNRSPSTRRDITPSKIPIFQASPKPIPMEYIFRSHTLYRSPSQPLDAYTYSYSYSDDDEDPSAPNLKRVKSESLLDQQHPSTPSRPTHSPTKRKQIPRPRSRSLGSMRTLGTPRSKGTPGKRPPSPKGEPPWAIQHLFSPSPYLPPEEQLLPTVAKRMQQERLEREKGLVTVWDRDMRPLEGDRRYVPSLYRRTGFGRWY